MASTSTIGVFGSSSDGCQNASGANRKRQLDCDLHYLNSRLDPIWAITICFLPIEAPDLGDHYLFFTYRSSRFGRPLFVFYLYEPPTVGDWSYYYVRRL
jgi:hypothetical protein